MIAGQELSHPAHIAETEMYTIPAGETTSLIRRSAAIAGRSSISFAAPILATGIVTELGSFIFHGKFTLHWSTWLILTAVLGGGWFLLAIVYTFFRLRGETSIDLLLESNPSAERVNEKHPRGFIAMEYYWLILNRSYVVFISPEGLYGGKFEGAVDTSNPLFFQPYADMLQDPNFVQTPQALQKIGDKHGNFFIPRADIVSVEHDGSPKWGMGSVPHTGKIFVHLASGKRRELILLGRVNGEQIRTLILQR